MVANLTRQTCTHFYIHMWRQGSNIPCLRSKWCPLSPRMLESFNSVCVIYVQRFRALPIHCILFYKNQENDYLRTKKKKLVRNLQNFSRCVIMCRISWRCGLGGPCSVRCGAAPSGPDLRGIQGTALVGSDGKAEEM